MCLFILLKIFKIKILRYTIFYCFCFVLFFFKKYFFYIPNTKNKFNKVNFNAIFLTYVPTSSKTSHFSNQYNGFIYVHQYPTLSSHHNPLPP